MSVTYLNVTSRCSRRSIPTGAQHHRDPSTTSHNDHRAQTVCMARPANVFLVIIPRSDGSSRGDRPNGTSRFLTRINARSLVVEATSNRPVQCESFPPIFRGRRFHNLGSMKRDPECIIATKNKGHATKQKKLLYSRRRTRVLLHTSGKGDVIVRNPRIWAVSPES